MTTITINFCSSVSPFQKESFVRRVSSIIKENFKWAENNIYPVTSLPDSLVLHCNLSLTYTCDFVSRLNALTLKSEGIYIDNLFYH